MSQHISSVDNLASKIKTVIFDCDGVLWLMDQKIEGATEIVQYLHDQNIRVFFVSNNSTKTTTQYLEKFKKLDFNMDIIDESQVISAARITAKCLANKGVKKAFVIGGKAIDAEMAREGVQAVRHEEELSKCEPQKIDFELDPEVTAVVAGMDINIDYNKLAIAASYVAHQNCPLYATNTDAALPGPQPNLLLPGAGATIAPILAATSRTQPHDIFGKPNTNALALINNYEGESTMMVGDRIETDIHFGVNIKCGVQCLVLSGASGRGNILKLPAETGKYAENVMDILQALKK